MRRLGARLGEALEEEQDRWFLWLPVLFGAGIALYFALPAEPSLMRAGAALTMALAVRLVWRDGARAVVVTGALIAVALGFAAAKVRNELVAAPVLQAFAGPVDVGGWVEIAEPRAGGGYRVTLSVYAMERVAPAERPARVRIRVSQEAGASLKPGDAVSVRAMLSEPAGPALPGGYDFARSAWFQSLGAVGYALAPPTADPNAGTAPLLLRAHAAIERLRQAIGARVMAALSGDTGAIANALVTGERGAIPEEVNRAYRDSGLLHVLSISGLHMAIMGGAVFVSVRFLLALVPALALAYPIKKWAAAAAMAGALGYLMISGASFPAVRSWIMISIMFLAVLLERPALALRNVALAALVILVMFPESLMDVSFQMSFAAVVALVAAYEVVRERAEQRGRRTGRRGPWLAVLLFFGGIVLSTLVASSAVAPFAAYHFHKSQQYAVLANLIAIPICNIVVMPAALAALVAMPFGLEWGPLQVMGMGIQGMGWCARAVADLPGAVASVPAMPGAAFALMLCGGLWLALWRTRWRLLGLCPIALGVAVAPIRTAPDVLVGRSGTLVAVRTESGELSALTPQRGGLFELARWLEHDGDRRPPETAAGAQAFRCVGSLCTAVVRGKTVTVAREPTGRGEACGGAAVVVLAWPGAEACEGETALTITQERLRTLGAHALYFGPEDIAVETVAAGRGQRPWTAQAPIRSRAVPQRDRRWTADSRRWRHRSRPAGAQADETGTAEETGDQRELDTQ